MSTLHKGQLMLLLAAAIWGFAFVAQIAGMAHLGPFGFMATRFGIGCCALLPLLIWFKPSVSYSQAWLVGGSLFAGSFLFAGSAFQQVGLQDTTAANAGFITSLYIVLVPLFGLLLGRQAGWPVYLGAGLAFSGLYLLSVKDNFSMGIGDARTLIGAFAWTGHVLAIGWLSPRCDPIRLAIGQYLVVALCSAFATYHYESYSLNAVALSWLPLAYTALMSTGVAFTLQIFAQREVPDSQAALIMSSEAVFAAFGGWLLLSEALTTRAYIGCAIMLMGITLAQRPARNETA